MAVTTVGEVLRRVKLTLQEITQNGTHWTNEELLGWLNESYQAVVAVRPDAASVNYNFTCTDGTKQTIPANGQRLLDVVRNLRGNNMAVIRAERRALDATRRGWHGEAPALEVEQYVFDELDPTHFYTYPPATQETILEIIYSSVPQPHGPVDATTNSSAPVRLEDPYVPAIVDYILMRAYSKDADHAANLQRSQLHGQAFATSLGVKYQGDMITSPNRQRGQQQ